jgi:hypothetical protein
MIKVLTITAFSCQILPIFCEEGIEGDVRSALRMEKEVPSISTVERPDITSWNLWEQVESNLGVMENQR